MNKQKLQILEALYIRNIQPKFNRINFESSDNVLKCFCLFVCLFVCVLWHIKLCRLFNEKSIFIHINSSISNKSV